MRRFDRGCRRGALTLIEVILAMGLITLLAGAMFAFYEASLRTRDAGVRKIMDGNLARVVAMKIADEIRSANGFLGKTPGVSGKDRMITLQTVVLPDKELFNRRKIQDARPPAESDIRQVQYYLAYDQDRSYAYPDETVGPAPMGLVRREIKTLNQKIIREDQQESVDLDLFAAEMKYLRFRYFDGVEWLDKWDVGDTMGGMGNSLPQAIEVTVGYTALPPKDDKGLDLENKDVLPSLPEPYSPETCTIQVKLPQADTFFGSRLMRAQQEPAKESGSSGTSGKGGGK
jgi:hypothetical protein